MMRWSLATACTACGAPPSAWPVRGGVVCPAGRNCGAGRNSRRALSRRVDFSIQEDVLQAFVARQVEVWRGRDRCGKGGVGGKSGGAAGRGNEGAG